MWHVLPPSLDCRPLSSWEILGSPGWRVAKWAGFMWIFKCLPLKHCHCEEYIIVYVGLLKLVHTQKSIRVTLRHLAWNKMAAITSFPDSHQREGQAYIPFCLHGWLCCDRFPMLLESSWPSINVWTSQSAWLTEQKYFRHEHWCCPSCQKVLLLYHLKLIHDNNQNSKCFTADVFNL